MAIVENGPAPYAPAQAVISIIEGYRERGLSVPFTLEVLTRAGVTESLAPRTLQALKLLELVADDGQPTETFQRLRVARGDEYRTALQDWLRNVYAGVLQFADPASDSPEKVSEAFRGYAPVGQRERMVVLMRGLFEYAGLITAEARREHKPRVVRRSASDSPRVRSDTTAARRASPATRTPPRHTTAINADGLPPAIAGLLQEIPRRGASWTSARRDDFLAAFRALLDFSVPVDDTPETELPREEAVDSS